MPLAVNYGSSTKKPSRDEIVSNRYEFFEHTADIGVHVHGATLDELFLNAAAALYDVLGRFELGERMPGKFLKLRADSLEDLLHDWLAELLYDFETQHVFYDRISIAPIAADYVMANLDGGKVDFAKSQTNEEIKAVAYHRLKVEQLPDGSWRASVIFDV
jgi:SHS2 domain-containing protein